MTILLQQLLHTANPRAAVSFCCCFSVVSWHSRSLCFGVIYPVFSALASSSLQALSSSLLSSFSFRQPLSSFSFRQPLSSFSFRQALSYSLLSSFSFRQPLSSFLFPATSFRPPSCPFLSALPPVLSLLHQYLFHLLLQLLHRLLKAKQLCTAAVYSRQRFNIIY